jgi:tetratricopeptide (TPR) repeat protein
MQRLTWSALAWVLVAASASAQENKLDGLRAAAKAAQQDAGASLALGKALRRAGHYTDALVELRRGLATPDGKGGDRATMLRYEVAKVYIDDRKFKEALAACAALGGTALGHACTASAHMTRKRATDALPEADLALERDPTLYEGKVAKADALAAEGSTAQAESELVAATERSPDRPEAFLRWGELLEAQGKRDAALKAFGKARAADADDPDAAYALGRMLPPNTEAVIALEAAVAGRPSFGAAWSRLADVRLALGKTQEAEQAALSAVKLDAKQAEWHAVLARVYAAEKRYDDALNEAHAALSLVSNMATAKLIEADVLAEKGEIDAALEGYQAAFGLARSDPSPLVHAARSCLVRGRNTSARGFAEHATQLFPKWGPGWEVLGDVLAKEKEIDASRQAYKTALGAEGPFDRKDVERKLSLLK